MQQHGLSTLQSDKLQFTKDHFMYEDNCAHRAGPRLVLLTSEWKGIIKAAVPIQVPDCPHSSLSILA